MGIYRPIMRRGVIIDLYLLASGSRQLFEIRRIRRARMLEKSMNRSHPPLLTAWSISLSQRYNPGLRFTDFIHLGSGFWTGSC